MKGYKAFGKGMVCRGKQYAENTVFEEETAEICNSGMHFCKSPLAVLGYYPLVDKNGDLSEFAEVEALDECKTDDNEKYCTKKLKIGTKIGFPQLVQASVELGWEKELSETTENTTDKDDARIGSSGNYAQIGSSGKNSVICCAGHGSKVKAKKGSWITLSEWKYSEDENTYVPVCVKSVQVDGEIIKEDVFYKLENGEFVEAED